MEPKYKNKPSDELIERYCKKLEKFLSAHNVSISVKLWNSPLRMEMYVDNKLTGVRNIWIKNIIITSDKVKDGFEASLMRHGIEENISDRNIWSDAWWIQDRMYRHLKLNPGHLSQGDPYWRLWDHLEKLKE